MEKVQMSLVKIEEQLSDDRPIKETSSIMDIKYLGNVKKKAEGLLKKINNMNMYEREGDYDRLYEYSRRVVASSQELTQMIRAVPIRYGDRNAYRNLKQDLSGSADTSMVKFVFLEEDVLQITLKELLPRRYNSGKIYENLDYIRCSYIESFRCFFMDKHIAYNDRVVILIKNYFTSEAALVDDDNFDAKIITDMIAQYVLIDDNPSRCMKVYDYGIGESSHTEITVFPMNKWMRYIEMPFC